MELVARKAGGGVGGRVDARILWLDPDPDLGGVGVGDTGTFRGVAPGSPPPLTQLLLRRWRWRRVIWIWFWQSFLRISIIGSLLRCWRFPYWFVSLNFRF